MPNEFLRLAADVLGIVVLDLVLSGDNAIVIGLAARRLPPVQQRLAIVFGGFGAILLRVLFATIAAYLLAVPLLQAVGGILLLWIAWKLLREGSGTHEVAEGTSLFAALQTIVLADVVMSLDNVLAVAGVSHGNLLQLALGLMLSMPIILFGSALIAQIMMRVPWLTLGGAGILAWTGGGMIREDDLLGRLVPIDAAALPVVPVALTLVVVIPSLIKKIKESWTRRAPDGVP